MYYYYIKCSFNGKCFEKVTNIDFLFRPCKSIRYFYWMEINFFFMFKTFVTRIVTLNVFNHF